jgi:hypothetical protein
MVAFAVLTHESSCSVQRAQQVQEMIIARALAARWEW